MRAPGIPRYRYRLADLDRERGAACTPKIRDHQQDAGRWTAIHAQDQGLEDRRGGRRRRVCIQAAGGRNESKSRLRDHDGIRRASPWHIRRSEEMTVSPSKLIIVVAAVTCFLGGLLWSGQPTIDGAFTSAAE